MAARIHRRVALGVLLFAFALAGAAVFWIRWEQRAGSANLTGYLPAANASVLYIDVNALRRSGILAKLAGSNLSEAPDYQQFVRDTKFDYRDDLDAIAAEFKDGATYFAVRGRFHWKDLKEYAGRQGGTCHDDYCVMPGSRPNRRISFYPLKKNLMAMAVAPDDFAAYQVSAKQHDSPFTHPNDPVWALIPAAALDRMSALPIAAQAFIPALKGADQIIVSIGADRNQQLQLGVHVTCKDAASASALQSQLEAVTRTLREAVARRNSKPNPSDLSSVLVAGMFRRDDRQVFGEWALPPAFIDTIVGSY